MFASGINKNTKKFAPKIPQRRKPGGPTPTPTPSSGLLDSQTQTTGGPPSPESTPAFSFTAAVLDDTPNEKDPVVPDSPPASTGTSFTPASTPIPPLDVSQHEPVEVFTPPATNEALSNESEALVPPTISKEVVQQVESGTLDLPTPTGIPTITPIPISIPAIRAFSPPTVPTVQPSVQIVVPTLQATPSPTPVSPHISPSVIPIVRSTVPKVMLSRAIEADENLELSEPRKRRRVSATSRPHYAPQENDVDEDTDVLEEVDDDRDEGYEEDNQRNKAARDDTNEERGKEQSNGLEEVSQTATTIAASINALLNAANAQDKDQPSGKGKRKAKAPSKPRAPRTKKTPVASTDLTEGAPISTTPTKSKKPRAPRVKKTPVASTDLTEGAPSSATPATTKKPRAPRKPRKQSTTTATTAAPEGAQEGVEVTDADPASTTNRPPRRRGRTREATPPNAEDIQIVPGVVKMSDLCRDIKIGRKSKRFTELENLDWTEVVRKQRAKKARIEAAKASGEEIPPPESMEERLERLAQENATARPTAQRHAVQVRVVNGQIVLDEETLQVDRRELVQEDGPREIVEESSLTRRVNAGTWSKREKPERWDGESTERFYEGLGMFGTDFELVSGLFPDRSRRQIKNKFNAEERKNPGRITAALRNRVAVDIDEYSRVTNTNYGDARELDRELEEMRAQHDEEERSAVEAAKELDRERREMQQAAVAAAGENVIGVVQPQKRRGKGKQGQFISRHQGGGEEMVLGLI